MKVTLTFQGLQLVTHDMNSGWGKGLMRKIKSCLSILIFKFQGNLSVYSVGGMG